jgi:nucleotide-binding universal stress UspA family protein
MRVLYATDGRQAAQAAGNLLERIGRRDGVELTVLSVSDLSSATVRGSRRPRGQ